MKRWGALLATVLLFSCTEKEVARPDAGQAPKGPVELAEKEPNDKPEQALPIRESAIVVASLAADGKKGDDDWYVLSAPTAQQVDLQVSGIGGADLQLEIFDQDKNPILTVNSAGEGQGERFPNLLLANTLYVRVRPVKKGAGGAYTLTALYSDPAAGAEHEPNDRAVDATALLLGEPIRGFIGHSGDEDWYRIELSPPAEPMEGAPAPPGTAPGSPPQPAAPQPAPPQPGPPQGAQTGTPPGMPSGMPSGMPADEAEGTGEAEGERAALAEAAPGAQTPAAGPPMDPAAAAAGSPVAEPPEVGLRIEASGVAGAQLSVSVLSEAEAPLFEIKGREGEGMMLRNIGVRASDRVVYVVVKSAWSGTGKTAKRGFNLEVPYTLQVSIEPAGANAEFEPNDTREKATTLPREGFREGFLSPKTDEDYYVLRTEGPVLAQFQVTGVDRVDLALEVVRAKADGTGEETVLRANDGAVKEPEQLNAVSCPGECFVKVVGGQRKIDGKWVRDFENAEQPYRLSVSVVPDTGSEEREPNNTVANATAVALGHPIRGTVHPRKDVDYYRVDLSGRPVRTPLRATLLGILKVDVGLYLHRVQDDGSLSLVQTSDRAKGEQPETIRFSAEPGVYVFEVRDSSRRFESNFQDRYQLTVQEGE